MSADKEEFLSRWSRLKREVKEQSPGKESQPGNQPPAPPAADPATPLRQLPPIEDLTLDSDYRDFFHPKVNEKVRLAALKKLFSDPHFNVMDGLDTYIDDYSKSDPIPAAMLATLRQAQRIIEWAKETPEETEANRAAEAAELLPVPVTPPDRAASSEVPVEQPPAVAVEPPPVAQLQNAEQFPSPSIAAERKS